MKEKPRYWATEWVPVCGTGTDALIDNAINSALSRISGRMLTPVNLVSVSFAHTVRRDNRHGLYVTVIAEPISNESVAGRLGRYAHEVTRLARMVKDRLAHNTGGRRD